MRGQVFGRVPLGPAAARRRGGGISCGGEYTQPPRLAPAHNSRPNPRITARRDFASPLITSCYDYRSTHPAPDLSPGPGNHENDRDDQAGRENTHHHDRAGEVVAAWLLPMQSPAHSACPYPHLKSPLS